MKRISVIFLSFLLVQGSAFQYVSDGTVIVEVVVGEPKPVQVYTPGPVDSTYEVWVGNLQNSTGSVLVNVSFGDDVLLGSSGPLTNAVLEPGEDVWANFRSTTNCYDCIKVTEVLLFANHTAWVNVTVVPHERGGGVDEFSKFFSMPSVIFFIVAVVVALVIISLVVRREVG